MAGKEITDDLDLLLQVMPPHLVAALRQQPDFKNLIEIVLDLGRLPEARFPDRAIYLTDTAITGEDLDYVTHRVGAFTEDNRAGIERTLHRISALRNRRNQIIGLTCRVGRAVYGTVDVLRVVRGLPAGLTDSAIDAIKQWQFRPGQKDGQNADIALNIEVNFNIVKRNR